jgi:hypothetical protein
MHIPARGAELSSQAFASDLLHEKKRRIGCSMHLNSSRLSPRINATIAVTFIPASAALTQFLRLLLLQLPPEWTDQFASGIQARATCLI